MSKKQAKIVWGRLSAEKRAQAIAAIPGFLAFCRANSWYRVVHAEPDLDRIPPRLRDVLAARTS